LIGPAPALQPGQRPAGPPGFLIDEIKLQGVVKTRQQGLVAMVNGPDNKGYLVKVGDKVLDGEVIRITPSSIVFRQEVNDPTRIERFREVVKELSTEAPRK
jgi:Tfp pilus assembly protein PilP